MRDRNNNQGLALVWILLICAIFAVLVIVIGWVTLSINTRSVFSDQKQQTYFTARSAVDTVFNQLGGTMENGKSNLSDYLNDYLLRNKYEVFIADMGFGDEMGSCSLKGTYNIEDKVVTLSATAKKDDMEDTVVLTAKRKASPTPRLWPNMFLADSLFDNERHKMLIQDIGDDCAVYVLEQSNTNLDTVLNFAATNGRDAIFIYVKEGAVLSVSEMKNWEYTKPDVFVYLANGSMLNFEVKNDTMVFPMYINGAAGSSITVKDNRTVTAYGLSGVSTSQGTVNIDASKSIPFSGYHPSGVPAEGRESGFKPDQWEKIQYKTKE